MKHLYRLVYWKRRLLGVRAGNVRRPSAAAYRRGRAVRISERARPPLVFALIVGVVLAMSALFGSLDEPHGGLGGETAPASDGGQGDHGYTHEVEQGWDELSPECREAFGSIAAYAEFHQHAGEQPEDPAGPVTAVAMSCGDGS